jgi:AraC family transcriptional regulator
VPDDTHPGKLLHGGEFYSRVESKLHTDEVLLSELRQPCSRSVPRHEHELAYITVVLNGQYSEGDHGKLEHLQPYTAVFNPAGVSHATIIGPQGAAFFTVELRDRQLKQLGMRLPVRTTFDRGAGSMLWPGLRLYSAFKTQTADPLLLEGLVMEMLGAVTALEPSGRTAPDSSAPRWLGRIKELLHAEFRNNVRMMDLAGEADVHPVHLARVFRRIEKQTPGDYLQRLRVKAACQLLMDPEYPISRIAVECGFADQSHLTRIFKRLIHSTPAHFRRRVGSLPARNAFFHQSSEPFPARA